MYSNTINQRNPNWRTDMVTFGNLIIVKIAILRVEHNYNVQRKLIINRVKFWLNKRRGRYARTSE